MRAATPRALGALVRRFGDFEACEDAVQEALLAASAAWTATGVPDDPTAWLITVASRRRIDQLRADVARMRRETTDAALSLREFEREFEREIGPEPAGDDALTLFVLCCHPSLTPTSQIALTLRAVAGLTTAQIAAAFLVPPAAMAKRITRAKKTIKTSGAQFQLPAGAELAERLRTVMHVIYLIFNEGYAETHGRQLESAELTGEAIRLAQLLRHQLPGDGEVVGLLALMLLIDARRAARTTPDGALVPLADQDHSLWDAAAISEGVALITDSLSRLLLGPYQVQAAIAALHAEAASSEDTDWEQILALYEVLERLAPSPMAALSEAVASAMVHGTDAGLAQLALLDTVEPLSSHHRLHAVRAHLLELTGERRAARAEYLAAAEATSNDAERRYLADRAHRLDAADEHA